ncbi:MAG: tetraacyldisaccharide 4'-kinase [Hyphomicrobiaceae bacterium]|nr:tetraacyldisaccharide 4'-kinase [Hyphomicrobiaceae bacterium]
MSASQRGDAPFWWYRDTISWQSRLITKTLTPVAAVYGAVATRRLNKPPVYTSKLPVICVGNFTAGGTGKTPLVRAICAHLQTTGHTPVILSRGYGGSIKGQHIVDKDRDIATQVGDEPLLLAQDNAVVVSADRAAGARFIEANESLLKATIIVMDDGLQNPSLRKDVRIAVVDRVRGIGNGRVIPAGPLRAPISDQIYRTDIIVTVTPPDANLTTPRPEIMGQFGIAFAFDTEILAANDTSWLKNENIVAYAGIGAPERFFKMLENYGAQIVDRVAFPDHHTFSETEATALLTRAKNKRATLVTTEKDKVRLKGSVGALAELATASRVIAITATLDVHATTAIAEILKQRFYGDRTDEIIKP